MFRRAWWTGHRIFIGVIMAALLLAAVVWECGSDEVREGQPLDEAKTVLWQAGAVTKKCGMYSSLGGHAEVDCSMWELPDGRTLFLVGARESDHESFRVYSFDMWQGWPKSAGAVELPAASAASLRRSVFVLVPGWFR
jgi:hypothetical protein